MTQIISPEVPEKQKLLKNLYTVVGVYGAIWVIFHLSCVFFFGFIVWSPLLVWLFLGIGNIWSMFIDVPLGNIQRHIPSKIMLMIASGFMFLAVVLFLYLMITSANLNFKLSGGIIEITRVFLSTGLNFILLLFAGILYGTVKETYEITTISYLLNHNDPSEYDNALSKNNIALGIWSVSGVILSIAILSLKTESVQLMLFVLMFLIVCVSVFIFNYFDNSSETFWLSSVKNLHVVEKAKSVEKWARTFIKNTISTKDFTEVKDKMDYIIMKPKELTKDIDWKDLYEKTKIEYKMIYKLVFEKTSFVPILLWSTGGILLFGCWDTIVTTFFITFLDEALDGSGVQNIIRSGFILIGLLAVPAYSLQLFWIKQAEKRSKYTIITMGIFLSAGALFGLAIFGAMGGLVGLILVVLLGMTNSTGYAASYPMSQSIFADEYNKSFARVTGSNIINADASAAPLKILNNFANAVGLIFWGALISAFGFPGMFFAYGAAVLTWWIISVKKKVPWNL